MNVALSPFLQESCILVCMLCKYASCFNSANKIAMHHMTIQLVKEVPRVHLPEHYFKIMSSRPCQRREAK